MKTKGIISGSGISIDNLFIMWRNSYLYAGNMFKDGRISDQA